MSHPLQSNLYIRSVGSSLVPSSASCSSTSALQCEGGSLFLMPVFTFKHGFLVRAVALHLLF
jgi:hypothetical protein